MTAVADFLVSGSPHLAANAVNGGQAHWRQLLAIDPLGKLAKLSGSFALGLTMPDGSNWLAVDRFGIETICYCIVDGKLWFAARADAFANQKEIDPQAIFDYLYFHCIPSPRTIYKGVYRLPPGHCAQFKNGQLTVKRFWQPDFAPPAIAESFEGLKNDFKQRLQDSVARQLDGTTPACFLSGGTDSSTIAGMIREVTGQAAHSYSIGFQAAGYDEMEYARLAAKHFKTVHHEYYVTPDDLVRSIPAVAAAYDQPFGNSSALPAYYCAKVAAKNGVTRMLAGDGGDELFGGNSRYAKQKLFGWYQHLPATLRSRLLEPAFDNRIANRLPLVRKASSYIEQARTPMPERLQMYNLLLRLGPEQVLTPDFLAQVDQAAPLRHQQQVWNQSPEANDLNRSLAFDWRYTLAESDLPKVRVSSALAGMNVGYPLLDQAMLDFSLKLPDRHKLKGTQLRWFFKEALRGFLPDQILTKKKQGFGLPFGVWLMRHNGLMGLARESLEQLGGRNIVQPLFIKDLFEKHLSQHPGYYGEMVWILMMLEQWLTKSRQSLTTEYS